MSNLIERLRYYAGQGQYSVIEEAIDEIERLRVSLKILWGILDQPPPEWKIIEDARKEVRKALAKEEKS